MDLILSILKNKIMKWNFKLKFKIFNEYRNPYYYWWKARHIFKRPRWHFMCGRVWFYGMPCNLGYYNRFITFRISGLGWKTKWDEYRHEWDPYIMINFFRKYNLVWVLNWINKKDSHSNTRSLATWESILDYLYRNKSIKWCIDNHVWLTKDGDITIRKNIRKKYLATLPNN